MIQNNRKSLNNIKKKVGKRMNFKKIGKVLLTVSFATLLVACGSGGEGSAESEGAVTIEYWHPNADTQGGQTVEALVEEFNNSQDNVIVEPVFNDGMYQGIMQNLQTQAAAGETPALIQIGWSYREYFANNFAFTEAQDIDTDNVFGEKFEDNIYALATANDGRQVGTPYSLSVPVLYLNTEILNEAGVNPDDLTSWEAVREAANQIAENTEAEGLYIAEHADNWNVQSMIESNGGQVIDENQRAAFASPESQETYQFYQDMINEGAALHGPNDQGQSAFISGDVGMAHMTVAQRANVTENGDFEAIAVESPAFEGEEKNLPAGGSMLVVTAQEEAQQQAAYEFMNFLYEPDSIAAWTKGTGYVPPTSDATENDELNTLLNEDPIFSAANNSLEYMVPWAPFPGDTGLVAEQMLIDLRDRILGGGDVEEETTTTQNEINEMIESEN